MRNIKNIILHALCIFCCILFDIKAVQRLNLFEPYEWLFDPVRLDCYQEFGGRHSYGIVISALGEYAFSKHGYCGSTIMGIPYITGMCKRKGNPLQLFTLQENAYSAFLGYDSSCNNALNEFAQQYPLYEGATSSNQTCLTGDFGIYQIRLSVEKWLNRTFRLGLYLPYYALNCHSVSTRVTSRNESYFEYDIYFPLYKQLDDACSLSVAPYNMQGIGDMSILLSWQDSFVEYRNTVTEIMCALRAGFTLPTRMHQGDEEDVLLPIPLGYDAAWGVQLGGSLEAGVGKYIDLGLSVDCTVLMGSLKDRKIKTDIRQTDIFLIQKAVTYLDPGMHQKFDIYCALHGAEKNSILTCAYQYNKQHDSDLIVCSDIHSSLVAASTQRLDPWSTHSLVVMGSLVNPFGVDHCIVQLAGKWGIAGERAVVCSTVTFSATYAF